MKRYLPAVSIGLFLLFFATGLWAQTITVGAVSGNISACAGEASSSTNVQQFTVSAAGLFTDINVLAPANFLVSLSAAGTYSNSVIISQNTGTVGNTQVFVKAATSAPVGPISGNVSVTSTGASARSAAVSGYVNAIPAVNKVPSQTVSNGDQTTAINFTGTGNTYNWVNNTPGIGLPSSGVGNIPAFTAVNNSNNAVTAYLSVTPSSVNFAYIPNNGDNTVSVINIPTGTVITTIPVGTHPFGTAVSPDGSNVYVTNEGSGTVSVIGTATNTVTATITVGTFPMSAAVSPDGTRVYVTNNSSNSVTVISAATNAIIATVNVGSQPSGIVVSPDGSTVYVANSASASVSVISTATNTVSTTFTAGNAPFGIALSSGGNLLYVSNINDNSVSVINTASGATAATISAGGSPHGIALSRDGGRLYVADYGSANVSVINTQSNSITTNIVTGQNPMGVSVNPDGSSIYVTNAGSNTVSVINAQSNVIQGTVAVGTGPGAFGNFIGGGTGCNGNAINFTITVNPTSQTAAITPGMVTGYISGCAGSPSAIPYDQQFTLSANGLTSGVIVTAPPGFEVSQAEGSGYAGSITIGETAGEIAKAVIYVRSAASAPTGNISGNVSLSSPGITSQQVFVSGIVNAIPTVATVAGQTVANGAFTTTVNFIGNGNAFNWINDTPSIGLPAGGVGDIASFAASNVGSTPVTATITVTPVPPGFAYIASTVSNTLSVVNTATYSVSSVITVGRSPYGVSISPDGKFVYVTNQGTSDVSVVNTTTNHVDATVTVGSLPTGVVVSPDGSMVYVACQGANSIWVISTATNTVVSAIEVGSYPEDVAISPDGTTLYVTNYGSNSVSVINTTGNVVIATIPLLTSNPQGIAISPDGTLLYVANSSSNSVTVISTINYTVSAVIPVALNPTSITLSPDGTRLYVSDSGDNTVSVINTATNALITNIPFGGQPVGLSVTPDGSRVFVANVNSNYVLAISTATNTIVSNIQVGLNPNSVGNFIEESSSCVGAPITFTITVTPTQRAIMATGSPTALSTTYGTASASTNFNISGTNLSAGILVTPPAGYEVSTDNVNFSSTVTVGAAGAVASTPVYIRLTHTAAAGQYPGNIVLTSGGAPDVTEPMPTGVVNHAPLSITAQGVTKMVGTILTGSSGVTTGYTVTGLQNSETVGSVTINYGAGSAAADAAGTYTNSVTVSLPAGGTFTASNYAITYVPANIVVTAAPAINTSGSLAALTTIYGTPSVNTSFSVSGVSLTSAISVTAPAGFELSTDGNIFSSSISISAANAAGPTTVHIRLAATTAVNSYTGSITLSSTGAAPVNLMMPLSSVTPAGLTVTADSKSKLQNAANPALTITYTGFVNNESPADLTVKPGATTTATLNSPPGQYPITASGGRSPDYDFNYVDGVLTVIGTSPVTFIPNTFTPNGDGINDTWVIYNLNSHPSCVVQVYNRWGQNVFTSIGYGIPWDGTYRGARLPGGTYYYVIDLRDGSKALSGFVLIVR